MRMPGYCTNCGSWFDRAETFRHCAQWQDPPPWPEIREHLFFHWNRTWDSPVQQIPGVEGSWVYRLWDKEGIALYVGMTERLRTRLSEHLVNKDWWSSVEFADAASCADRSAAMHEEAQQIRALHPVHNIHHNGDS